MKNSDKLKHFIKIASPKKSLFIWLIIFYLLLNLIAIYMAIPSANIIDSIANADIYRAAIWLIILCTATIFSQIIGFAISRISIVSYNQIVLNIHNKIYQKIIRSTNQALTAHGQEKILNVAYNNLDTLGLFPTKLAQCICEFIEAIIVSVIILFFNIYIGLAIIVLSILNYLITNAIHSKSAKSIKNYYSSQDNVLKVLTDSYNNINLSKDLSIEDKLKDKFNNNLENSLNNQLQYGKYYSLVNNWLPLISRLFILLCSIYMIHLTQLNIFTFSLYIILSEYLVKSINKFSQSFKYLQHINLVNTSSLRIQEILDLDEEVLPAYGKTHIDTISPQIEFTGVCYTPTTNKDSIKLKQFNLIIPKNSITLFNGEHLSGKRTVFELLTRKIRPSAGTITIGGINILDFTASAFKNIISVCTRAPFFYKDTILYNLQLSQCASSTIYSYCKQFGLHKKIITLSNSYYTQLHDAHFSSYQLFLLGIIQSLCKETKIIIIYEFPQSLSRQQKNQIKKYIKLIAKTKTVIIFSFDIWCQNISKNVLYVKNGKVNFGKV